MKKPRIMVVDDEAVITMQLEEFLVSMGYDDVTKASSGKDAITKARDLNPDLIIMDIVMPGVIDGIAASKVIKEELSIPVLFLTAYGNEELINRAKVVEPLGYIIKPFNENKLQAAVEIALYRIEQDRQRIISKEKLEIHNESLSQLVAKRTEALTKLSNELQIKNRDLEEVNIALEVMLKRSNKNKKELEGNVLLNIKELIIPYIEKLRESELSEKQASCLNVLESNLNNIISPFSHNLSSSYTNLSHSELKVASLIKDGRTTKDISQLMNLSQSTIESYRKSIRKKLKIKNKNVNLSTYLLSLK